MFWRRGWLLNSLRYRVEKDLRDTVYKSESYRKHKWGIIEHQVTSWAKRPTKFFIRLFVAIFLISYAAFVIEKSIFPLEQDQILRWAWIYDWQQTILSAQLTLIGFVFPLVVGLVGFLLQQKTASNALWSLYKHYSGFLFVGFSGLLLSLFIVSGLFLEELFPVTSYTLLCFISVFWFCMNIALSGWFLWATFQVVHKPSRDNLLLRYTINESFDSSIRRRISFFITDHEISRGIIPKVESSGLEVSTFRISRKQEEVVTEKFNEEVFLHNVYFRLLRLAFYLTTLFSKKMLVDENPTIILPMKLDDRGRKEFEIVVFRGIKPNPIAVYLFKASYRFEKTPPFEDDTLDDVIYALVGSALDDLKEGNEKLFGTTVKLLAEWHCAVSEALSFVDDYGEQANWLVLSGPAYLGSRYSDDLLRQYYLLAKKTVQLIPQSSDFYESIIYLYLRLYSWHKGSLPKILVCEYINGSSLSWQALVEWSSLQEPKPVRRIYNYENAIKAFVGAWESWPTYLEPRSTRWEDSIDFIPLFLKHLECTARLVVTAARFQDELAMEWAADMLINWHSNVVSSEYSKGEYYWYHEIVTHCVLNVESNKPLWDVILKGNKHDEKSAELLAIENAWIDIRLLCACYLLSRSTPDNQQLYQDICDALLQNNRLKPTGGIERNSNKIRNGADIVAIFIRLRCYWGVGSTDYSAWVDSLIDSFARQDEPRLVSGRMYSGMGGRGLTSLYLELVKFCVQLSDAEWALNTRWVDILFSSIVSQESRDQLISDLKSWQAEAVKIEGSNIYTIERISNFNKSLQNTIVQIKNRNLDEVRKAEIDKDRLVKFGRLASASAFSQETGSSILQMFEKISIVTSLIPNFKWKINIQGYSKQNIAKDIDVPRVDNEAEWLDEVVSQNVALRLYGHIYNLASLTRAKFTTPFDLFLRIANDIKAEEKSNLKVFIGSWKLQHYLLDLAHKEQGDSENLDIEKKLDPNPEYLCHLQGTPVFSIPNSRSENALLVDADIFKSVVFTKYDDGRYVDVTYEDLDDETLQLKLVLTYYMRPNFGKGTVRRYSLKASDEEAE